MTTRTVKAEVHELIDTLSYDELVALKEFLCRLQATEDLIDRSLLRASLREPEELSEADRVALREADEDFAAGRVFTLEEIKRAFPPDEA